MIDYRQSRAARSLLGWTQQQLSEAAGVARTTIEYFETNKRTPIPNNLSAICSALEVGGVEFIAAKAGRGVGVRLRED